MKQTLNQLLVELDGFKQSGNVIWENTEPTLNLIKEGIIVIGATNFPESLDKYVCSVCIAHTY
jgi:ATP-dependent metalloprotease